MAAQKHLRELLQEDQEPFHLNSYISDRQCQIKRPTSPPSRTHLQVKKRKPISQNSSFPSNFCKNACFFSFHESPDPRKSPLFGFRSPNKSPNALFLNIPARTAALLLEAAVRVQKQTSETSKSGKTQNRGNGFGLFGSVLKKLTSRKKREIAGDGIRVAVKDILRWDSPVSRKRLNKTVKNGRSDEEKSASVRSAFETHLSYERSISSAVWSESNEEKSLDFDFETSSSSSEFDGLEEIDEFAGRVTGGENFADYDNHFCESPFHFVLQTSPSPGRRTPNFSSPAPSPCRQKTEGKENYEVESLKKLQVEEEEEEEEDKEQCSPVSVLDPPFEDDDDGHVDGDEGYHLESSYAVVQRAKQQLLQKLRRFEQSAGLDPVELEKRMSEQETDADLGEEQECEHVDESCSSDGEESNISGLVQQILQSTFDNFKRIPEGMKRLVYDLIMEEETDPSYCIGGEAVAKRVCKRLDSWKEVESNTIDMMVEQDFRDELNGWKKNQEEVQEAALEIELAIFGYLLEEFSEELVSF